MKTIVHVFAPAVLHALLKPYTKCCDRIFYDVMLVRENLSVSSSVAPFNTSWRDYVIYSFLKLFMDNMEGKKEKKKTKDVDFGATIGRVFNFD